MSIDLHIHLAGVGDRSDCIMERKLRIGLHGLLAAYYGHPLLKKVTDDVYFEILSRVLSRSELLTHAVILAFDRPYSVSGEYWNNEPRLYVSNRYTKQRAEQYNRERIQGLKALWGASVHPDRLDALDELDRVVAEGAVLLKWIPSTMGFDPGDKRHIKFYEKVASYKIPILWHMGTEHTVAPPCDDCEEEFIKLNHPCKAIRALDCGVTIIAAHTAIPSKSSEPNYAQELLKLLRRKNQHWRLYGDTAAFTIPWYFGRERRRYAQEIIETITTEDLGNVFVLGSDFPGPVGYKDWFQLVSDLNCASLQGGEMLDELSELFLLGTRNMLDHNIEVLRDMGLPEYAFTAAGALFPSGWDRQE